MLISNLPRLDKESSLHQEGVDSTVNTLSHLLELHPSLLATYWSTDLYSQLLDRLDVESLDETSLACSELLFSLASDSGAIDAMAQKPVGVSEKAQKRNWWIACWVSFLAGAAKTPKRPRRRKS